MQDDLAVFLWRRRMSARIKMIFDALQLIVDFWTALYIVVPSLILLVYIFRGLLVGLPAWFTPEWEICLLFGLAYFMVNGNQRSYLEEIDLTFLYANSREFHRLFRVGMQSSLVINNLGIVLLMAGLYPFYLHLEAVSLQAWLGIGLWTIILRIAFLLILFWLQDRWRRIVFRLLFFMGFIAVWTGILIPFLQTDITLYGALLLGIALFMMVSALLIKYFWPIYNWEKLVQDEANYNIRIMGQLLGYAGKPMRKRNGASLWSQRRWGIPFQKRYALTYFYLKYFWRLKLVWQVFMKICAVCLLVALSSVPYEAILGFLAAGQLMLGLFVRSVVAENAGKLEQFIQGLDSNDINKGLRTLYIIMIVPPATFPLFSGLAGTMSLMQVLGGIIILLAGALISSQLMFNFSCVKQYLIKR